MKLAEVGVFVRTERKRRGLTQLEFAELTGLGRVSLTNIERGFAMPKAATMRKIALALGFELQITFDVQFVELQKSLFNNPQT